MSKSKIRVSKSSKKPTKKTTQKRDRDGRINIADFKAKLGHFMGQVRGGNEVIVMDRNRPIAKLIPYSDEHPKILETIPAQDPFMPLRDWAGKAIEKIDVDILKILDEVREDR